MKRQQETCRCDAYKFPHRKASGTCQHEPNNQQHDSRAWWQIAADEAGVSDKDFK